MKWLRNRKFVAVVAAFLIALPLLLYFVWFREEAEERRETGVGVTPQAIAPPDLEKNREDFIEAAEALARSDGQTAVERLTSFSFGSRAVEEYRLYYLANAYQLTGQDELARRTLMRLWERQPRLIYREDVAFHVGSLYTRAGAWHQAAEIYGTLAARSDQPAVEAAARWQYVKAKLADGDPVAAWVAARNIVIQNPKTAEAADALATVRALSGIPGTGALPLTLAERVERAGNLLRDGDPASAVSELSVVDADALPAGAREQVLLNRGLALNRLRRFEDSEKALEPLFTGFYKYAVPALACSARNNGALAASINPIRYKTVKEKKRVGTVKVKRKGKIVRRPKYKTVSKQVKLVDLAAKAKKETFERTRSERLKDILDIPGFPAQRREAMLALFAIAEEKKQYDYMRELAPEIVALDRLAEPGLQFFWNRAWAAYASRDLATADDLFRFISQTYEAPNIQRQSKYWLARTKERRGEKEEAASIYAELADVQYADLYARFAERRGAKPPRRGNAKLSDAPDWREYADRHIPDDLRIAYELSSLGALRDSRLEIQKNLNDGNRRWADALLGILLHAQGAEEIAYRHLRRAWPELATVEQMTVPRQVLALYYPLQYENWIVRYAKSRDLDPFLVMALIRQESSYDPQARSPVGASGLMQIMPATGAELGRKLRKPFAGSRLEDPEVNIELGTYYLRQLINWVGGSEEKALAAYNGGIGNVRKWEKAFAGRAPDEFIESIPFSETRGYVKRITLMRSTYEQLHQELQKTGEKSTESRRADSRIESAIQFNGLPRG